MIFVTPHILKAGETLEALKQKVRGKNNFLDDEFFNFRCIHCRGNLHIAKMGYVQVAKNKLNLFLIAVIVVRNCNIMRSIVVIVLNKNQVGIRWSLLGIILNLFRY